MDRISLFAGRLATWALVCLLPIGIGCSKKDNKQNASNQSQSINDSRLIELLDSARAAASDLGALSDPAAQEISKGLLEALANLDKLIFEQKRVNQDPLVLAEIDYIVYGLSRAGDYNLQSQIDNLKAQIAQLRLDLDTLSSDYNEFKTTVLARLDAAEEVINAIETDMAHLASRLDGHISASTAADAALRAAVEDLQRFTETEIAAIHEANLELAEAIAEQKGKLDDLFQSEAAVANLQDKICKSSSEPNMCTPSQVSQMLNGGTPACACIPVASIDCSVMFPGAGQTSAQNQCNIIVSVLRNHDDQLRLIREVDERQTDLISGLLDDVESLNDQVGGLARGFDLVNEAVQAIQVKIDEMDARLIIQELKTERLEAAASINERADLNLAWITRRIADVRKRYCEANVRGSLNKSDYKAARQNWEYCHERLGILNRAKEHTHIAKAFVNGAVSANMDTLCSAIIVGNKKASELTVAELMTPSVFRKVKEECQHGKAVVLGSFLNAVALLDTIGPDFRTVEYMARKSRIGQLLAFKGKDASELSTQDKNKFENIDPTTTLLMNTAYGAIERAFKYKYVEKALRTSQNKFPVSADEIPPTSGFLHVAFRHSEIKGLSPNTPYMQRLRDLEIPGHCQDCGFKVAGRNPGGKYNPQVNRNGKKRFAYPVDASDHCPIENQHVVLKNNDNGHHYVFNLNYSFIWERLTPHLRGGNQVRIARGNSDISGGQFGTCRTGRYVSRSLLADVYLGGRWNIRVTQPYSKTYPGQRGTCAKFTVVCVPQKDEWVAPAGATDINAHFIGYPASFHQNACAAKGGTAITSDLTPAEKKHVSYFNGEVDSATSTRVAQAMTWSLESFKKNPLGESYWVTAGASASYGNNNQTLNNSRSFYGANGVGNDFIRVTHSASGLDLQKQECKVPGGHQ